MDPKGATMIREAYFDRFTGPGWPTLSFLAPYFVPRPKGRGWFDDTGNDSANLKVLGVDGTEHLPYARGRLDISLSMWGNSTIGALLIYYKLGAADNYLSAGDMSRIREWVRSTHDTPLPVGLFIPFDQAWLAVKEFMETDGQLPASIAWVKGRDLPEGTFPDP
jgi:hypothetical protein